MFLERVFHKLLINFAWWVNKRDVEGNNLFEGGFLGLDNISVFDRSEPLPPGVKLEQADATAWMAMYCLDLMRIALELAVENSAYEDLASKFLEHFLRIAYALHHAGGTACPLWDDDRGFYYDILDVGGRQQHLRVRSMVGLIPLFAVHVISPEVYRRLDNFRRRTEWFLDRYPHFAEGMVGRLDGRHVLSAVTARAHRARARPPLRRGQVPLPLRPALALPGARARAGRCSGRAAAASRSGTSPASRRTRMKGGNSNWRGPVWFPTGYLLYRSLLRLDHGFGDALRIPAVNGRPPRTLAARAPRSIADAHGVHLRARHRTGAGPSSAARPSSRATPTSATSSSSTSTSTRETGEGLGASHQTGWTGLVGEMVLRLARRARGQD